MARGFFWFPIVLGVVVGCTTGSKELDSGSGPAVTDSGSSAAGPGSIDGLAFTIERDALWGHLESLSEIAMAHDGNRAAGTTGYNASVEYVSSQLAEVGYSVSSHPFTITREQWNQEPVLSMQGSGAATYELYEDFMPFQYGSSGDVTAAVQSVDIQVPPNPDEGSTSGCEAEDFDGFEAGRIALIQRGECTFQTKTDLAVAAGAAAVLIFNEGTQGRQDVFQGTLDSTVDSGVPVIALRYDVGVTLSQMEPDQMVHVMTDVSRIELPTENVMVETDGDPDRVIVVGGHLDSVEAGPGINDNGSGVALVLELARVMKQEGIVPANQIRFVLWGGEELGLLGSMDYVFGMDDAEQQRILANLNFDMVASPNPVRFVYDGDGSDLGQPGPRGSDSIESMFTNWFDEQDLDWQATAFDGRSDYGPFIWSDIPAGGLFTGAEVHKTPAEALVYGGEAGVAFDACYHQQCDTLENVDMDMLEEMAGAATHVLMEMGNQTGAFGARKSAVQRTREMVPLGMSSCGGSHEHSIRWRQ